MKGLIARQGYGGTQEVPFAHGEAVIFPDCQFRGPPPPGAENTTIFDANELPFLERRIAELLRKWSPKANPTPLSPVDLAAIKKGLLPAFQLMPVLGRRVADNECQLIRLTDDQTRVLDLLETRPRAAIQGVAGSGKTLLALAQARRFAQQGMTVLLTCFNKTLAHWLETQIEPMGRAGAGEAFPRSGL